MGKAAQDDGSPGGVGADPARLGNPLDLLLQDHLFEREICAKLGRMASADNPDLADLPLMLGFLRFARPLHHEDEEADLFPLLRRRCLPEDEIDRAIARLTGDHDAARPETRRTIAILERIEAGGRAPDTDERRALADYAARTERHLTLENAVILPLARSRLTPADLETLRRGMLARRGLDRVMEKDDAE